VTQGVLNLDILICCQEIKKLQPVQYNRSVPEVLNPDNDLIVLRRDFEHGHSSMDFSEPSQKLPLEPARIISNIILC
jgi:hypothetical protein